MQKFLIKLSCLSKCTFLFLSLLAKLALQRSWKHLFQTSNFGSVNISVEILTPSLAWAFFGPDEDLSKLMNNFKSEVLGFLDDIFK